MAAHLRPPHQRHVCKLINLCLLILCLINVVQPSDENEYNKSCLQWYKDGMDAYLDERWQHCIDSMETAIKEYKNYKKSIINCRIQCTREADESKPIAIQDVEDLQFYERTLRNTLCLLKCRKKEKVTQTLSFDATKIFEELKPYDYLQLCYFQKNMFPQAANAAFTFLVGNPNHTTMLTNLKYYSSLSQVDVNEIVNHEAANFVSLYVHGSDAYSNEDYTTVVHYFEESLVEYLRAEEECRSYCEGPFDQGWFPDFTLSIANHFTYCLKCKQRCASKLNSLNGERHEDILPSHYHYLQYAYFKAGNLKKACEAAMSYLLFYPVDETMLENLDYYKTLPKIKKEFFKPREEAIIYIQRQQYETKILDFINKDFTEVEDNDEDNEIGEVSEIAIELKNEPHRQIVHIIPPLVEHVNLAPPPVVKFSWLDSSSTSHTNDIIQPVTLKPLNSESINVTKIISNEKKHDILKKKNVIKEIRQLNKREIRVVMGEKELKGKLRFLADGFAETHECQELILLAQSAAIQGDGYSGNKSPHTENERFEGVSLGRAALLVYFGIMEPRILDLYLNLSERGMNYVERYFKLKNKLYFTYTHLVCRTALEGAAGNRTDLSHAVHADNCNLQENGDCTNEPPAYTWRDYSAILYLNENFEGGEFIFSSDMTAKNIQSTVHPKCGRLVGFSAGRENLHGVNGVQRGSRCALGLWFTFDKNYIEVERILAQQVLTQVQNQGSISENLYHELKKHVPFESPTDTEIP